MLSAIVLPLLLLLGGGAPGVPDPFAPLALYAGTWTVHALHPSSGGSGADTLVNHCTRGEAFFSCEQIVNGKPSALVVFTVGNELGKYDVDRILPNGHASSDTDLFIKGDHWTYVGHEATGKVRYRTENVFRGRDAIHFEQFESREDGTTWTKTNEGDETRAAR